jgi:hypothetical protein
VSNGFALLVELITQQHRNMGEADTNETEEHTEDEVDQLISTPAPEVSWTGSSNGHGGNDSIRSLESDEIVRRWERGCIVCRARGRGWTDHAWQDFQVDADHTEAAHKGVWLMNSLQAPLRTTGFCCWAKGKSCRCWIEGKRGGCSGSAVVWFIVGVGRYDKQYRFQFDAKKKAMSPRIFADMQRRNVCRPFDRLPIVANSCNYAIRFVSKDMSEGDHDLKLCLLTMGLLSGELLRSSRDIKKLPAEKDIANYMQYISFNEFDPPVTRRHLSYLKACRLHRVSLQQAGIWTQGILWSVNDTLLPSTWPLCPQKSRKRCQIGLSNFQRDRLLQLADLLCISGAEGLASAIRRYLKTDMTVKKPTAAKKYMDIMAGSIVEAMGAGTPLHTAGVEDSRAACAIFVGDHDQEMTIFTPWQAGIDVDGRWRQSHVLLGVEIEGSLGTPVLDTVKWVNGLAFFKRCEQTAVVFKWPRVRAVNTHQ